MTNSTKNIEINNFKSINWSERMINLKSTFSKERYLEVRENFKLISRNKNSLPHEIYIINSLLMNKDPSVTTHDVDSESYKKCLNSALYYLYWFKSEDEEMKRKMKVYRYPVLFKGDLIGLSELIKVVFKLTEDEARSLASH